MEDSKTTPLYFAFILQFLCVYTLCGFQTFAIKRWRWSDRVENLFLWRHRGIKDLCILAVAYFSKLLI